MERLPSIPLSKRGFIFQIEHARVEVDGGRVVLLQAEGALYKEYNLPAANTSMLLMGEGTSITRDAARILADNRCIVAFTGGGGSPFVSASEETFLALTSQDEYRPTQYMQAWAKMFFDEKRRLETAKNLLRRRIDLTERLWEKSSAANQLGLDSYSMEKPKGQFLIDIEKSESAQALCLAEGRFAKKMYAAAAKAAGPKLNDFSRQEGKRDSSDLANSFLDHANYLAYGCAAIALHGLGISFAFAVLHGKTRRGGLVFDVADLIKDGLCLPIAFFTSITDQPKDSCRAAVIEAIHHMKILDILFEEVKGLIANA
jgi:CRISPR-associated protein Cas1